MEEFILLPELFTDEAPKLRSSEAPQRATHTVQYPHNDCKKLGTIYLFITQFNDITNISLMKYYLGRFGATFDQENGKERRRSTTRHNQETNWHNLWLWGLWPCGSKGLLSARAWCNWMWALWRNRWRLGGLPTGHIKESKHKLQKISL